MRRAAVLLIAALALMGTVSTAEARGERAAQALVELSINGERADHGCGPLRMHAGLARSAARQARLLLADGELDHDAGSPMAERLHRAAPSALMLGEDLAWGTGSDAQPEAIVQAWMDSPPHRRIMLDCRFSQLGVGIAAGRFGDLPSATVYVADFAA
jgi:uncharacterized protein YkwD